MSSGCYVWVTSTRRSSPHTLFALFERSLPHVRPLLTDGDFETVPLRPCQAFPEEQHAEQDARRSQRYVHHFFSDRLQTPDTRSSARLVITFGSSQPPSMSLPSSNISQLKSSSLLVTPPRTSKSSVLPPAIYSLPFAVMKNWTP